jgi:hypothetical protein
MRNAQVLQDFLLDIDVDGVLLGQGADPQVLRSRNANLIKVAEKAIETGQSLIRPRVLYREYDVVSYIHGTLKFEDGLFLKGALIGRELGSASRVALALCTIGKKVEERISFLMSDDPVLALALDGYANAAVDLLAETICHQVEETAKQAGLETSLPVSPGLEGWPVEEGQPQIFKILKPDTTLAYLTSGFQIIPRKSTSLVIGMGQKMRTGAVPCDYCAMRQTCRYRAESRE